MNDSERRYLISFEDMTKADASRYANDLKRMIQDASENTLIERQQNNPLAMDLGTTLVLVLGTPTLVAISNAIGNFLIRTRVTITIKTEKGEVVGTNLSSKDAYQLAELFIAQK